MWQDIDDDHFMNKCRNATVLTRVELSSKAGSTLDKYRTPSRDHHVVRFGGWAPNHHTHNFQKQHTV